MIPESVRLASTDNLDRFDQGQRDGKPVNLGQIVRIQTVPVQQKERPLTRVLPESAHRNL